ncbi:MAG: DUF1016 N-terminal domain-containing protein [Candidatus Omnitrophica bacterium]|nr:DUF1016 N-terminal domain-containing protein [Candidatus Omnitrophota bacterium]
MMKTVITIVSLLIFLFPPSLDELIPSCYSAEAAVTTYGELLRAIRQTRAASRARIEAAAEQEKLREAWETGRLIDRHVLQHKERAGYGMQVLKRLAKDLGTSKTELYYMLEFARQYPIFPHAGKLPWNHYRELLSIKDKKRRDEIAEKASIQHWTRDQLREAVRIERARTQSKNSSALVAPVKLPEITPGPLSTYQIIRLKDSLKIDLGFGIYRDLPEKFDGKFKEGDIVNVRRKDEIASQKTFVMTGDSELAMTRTEDATKRDLFTYHAQVTRIVDGDTFHALIDLGFETTVAQRVRLRRVDAPELLTAAGKEAKIALGKILKRNGGRIILQSRNLDQHGRPIADVFVEGQPVDQQLLDQGLVVPLNE